MSDVEEKNAIIKHAKITIEDGFLDVWLTLDYGDSGQGFGGYTLYLPPGLKHHSLESHAGHFIYRVLAVAGCTRWEELPGKCIRVRADHCGVYEIGHITKNDWFSPKKDFSRERLG